MAEKLCQDDLQDMADDPGAWAEPALGDAIGQLLLEVARLRSDLAAEREMAASVRRRVGAADGEPTDAAVGRFIANGDRLLSGLRATWADERALLKQDLHAAGTREADLRARLEVAEASEERLAEALANLDGGLEMARVVAILDETREARERAEDCANAVLHSVLAIIHDLDSFGVPGLAVEHPDPMENLAARVDWLRAQLAMAGVTYVNARDPDTGRDVGGWSVTPRVLALVEDGATYIEANTAPDSPSRVAADAARQIAEDIRSGSDSPTGEEGA